VQPWFEAQGDGYWWRMTENSGLPNEAEDEAVQAVVDRVRSWHAGSTPQTVAEELRQALTKAGVSRDDAWVHKHAERISKADPLQS
jgi:hypothetical protein